MTLATSDAPKNIRLPLPVARRSPSIRIIVVTVAEVTSTELPLARSVDMSGAMPSPPCGKSAVNRERRAAGKRMPTRMPLLFPVSVTGRSARIEYICPDAIGIVIWLNVPVTVVRNACVAESHAACADGNAAGPVGPVCPVPVGPVPVGPVGPTGPVGPVCPVPVGPVVPTPVAPSRVNSSATR